MVRRVSAVANADRARDPHRKAALLQSQASAALTGTTIAICLLGLWLPVSHFAHALNLVPLPHQYLLALLEILPAYMLLAQLVKGWLIKRFGLS